VLSPNGPGLGHVVGQVQQRQAGQQRRELHVVQACRQTDTGTQACSSSVETVQKPCVQSGQQRCKLHVVQRCRQKEQQHIQACESHEMTLGCAASMCAGQARQQRRELHVVQRCRQE
jgi:hypothetical protein